MRVIKKIILISLAAIISLTSVVTILSRSTTAKKGDPIYTRQSIENEGQRRLKLNSLAACFEIQSGDSRNYYVSELTPTKGAIVSTSTSLPLFTGQVAAGFIDTDNGDMNCASYQYETIINLLHDAGWQGATLFSIFCGMGEDYINGKEKACSGELTSGDYVGIKEHNIANAIAAVAPLNEYAYYLGYQALKSDIMCGDFTDMGIVGTDIQSTDINSSTDATVPVFIYNSTTKLGTTENHVYRLNNPDKKVSPFNPTENGFLKPMEWSCKTIAAEYMSRWLKDYKLYKESSTSNPAITVPAPKTAEEACSDPAVTNKEACIDGYNHASQGEQYCNEKYPTKGPNGEIIIRSEEIESCKLGIFFATKKAPNPSKDPNGSDPITDPTASANPQGNSEEDQENCKIDYIGWVICPVVNTLASMSEGARARLVKMLTVDTKSILGDTSEGSVYSYWSKIRDYANILFVIFFLFVIYSQITGYGLDNYGIKRMLPKLIVGVIAVNISFYICGLLIDLSNVVGSSAFNFISTAAVGGMPAGDWNDSDQGWISSIAAGALLLTVGYFALATVISVLLFVVITAVTTIFLLGVREAIIILCTVISPLAFAAMIMPNTEGLYKKWWNVFKASLMVFPMVGLVYGASNLAARILGASVEKNDFILKSVITLLIFAPLPVVPKLVKSAVEIIGIGGLVAGAEKWMNKKRGAMTDKVGKWRENKLTSQFGKHRREKAQLRNAQIRGGTYRGKGGIANFRNWRSAANRRLNAKSGDFGQKRKLAGSAAALAEDNERMKAANAWIADNNMSSDRLAEIATGFTRDKDGKKVAADLSGISSYQRRAAMQALAPHMTSKQASDLAEASASFGDASLQKEAANAIAESGAKKAPWLGGKQLEAIRQGTYNEKEAMADYIKNKASGSGLANADADAVRRMVEFSTDQARHNADNSYMKSLMNARASLDNDPKTAGTVPASVRAEINKIPPLQQQQTHGTSSNQGAGSSQGSSGSPSPKGSTPPPNPGSGSGGQGPQNSTPPPKPSNTPDTSKSNSSSDPGSDSGSSNSSNSSSSDSSGGGTTTHNGQTFTQTSSGLYIPKH